MRGLMHRLTFLSHRSHCQFGEGVWILLLDSTAENTTSICRVVGSSSHRRSIIRFSVINLIARGVRIERIHGCNDTQDVKRRGCEVRSLNRLPSTAWTPHADWQVSTALLRLYFGDQKLCTQHTVYT